MRTKILIADEEKFKIGYMDGGISTSRNLVPFSREGFLRNIRLHDNFSQNHYGSGGFFVL